MDLDEFCGTIGDKSRMTELSSWWKMDWPTSLQVSVYIITSFENVRWKKLFFIHSFPFEAT